MLHRSASLVRWIAVIGLAVLIGACGGGDGDDDVEETATPGAGAPITTATPFATVPQPTIVTDANPQVIPPSDQAYVVEAGDTLGAIAARFDTSVAAIQNENGLTGTNIFVGQQLTIPSGTGDAADDDSSANGGGSGDDATPPTYTVQSGDLASVIAERFNVSLAELAAENDVSVDDLDNLFVGQVLNIPSNN